MNTISSGPTAAAAASNASSASNAATAAPYPFPIVSAAVGQALAVDFLAVLLAVPKSIARQAANPCTHGATDPSGPPPVAADAKQPAPAAAIAAVAATPINVVSLPAVAKRPNATTETTATVVSHDMAPLQAAAPVQPHATPVVMATAPFTFSARVPWDGKNLPSQGIAATPPTASLPRGTKTGVVARSPDRATTPPATGVPAVAETFGQAEWHGQDTMLQHGLIAGSAWDKDQSPSKAPALFTFSARLPWEGQHSPSQSTRALNVNSATDPPEPPPTDPALHPPPPVAADPTLVRNQDESPAAPPAVQSLAPLPAPTVAPQTTKVPASTTERDPSTPIPTEHATSVLPAFAVPAAPPVTHHVADEALNPQPEHTLPGNPDPAIPPASHHEATSLSFQSAPRPVEHAAVNVQVMLDGVRGGVAELRQNGQVAIHLQLSPPELGHVRMQLVAHDQQVDVRLVVQNGAAGHVLATQADTLRERLGSLGVALGRFDVQQDGGSPTPDDQPAPEQSPTPSAGSRRRGRGAGRPGTRGVTGINVIA